MNPFDLAKQMPQLMEMGQKLIAEVPAILEQWKNFQDMYMAKINAIAESCERMELLVGDIHAEVCGGHVMTPEEKAEFDSWPTRPTAQASAEEIDALREASLQKLAQIADPRTNGMLSHLGPGLDKQGE